MKNYRLDPNNPRQLTDEEARRLDEAAIDYSDLPPPDEQFLARAKLSPYVVLNPLLPSRIEWLKRQALRVAAVFRSTRRRSTNP